MPIQRAQVTIYPTSNTVRDAATNTFYFDCTNTLANYQEIALRLGVFYQSLVGLYSNLVRQSLHDVKVYNNAAAAPNPPVFSTTFAFPTAPAGSPLPTECAIVSSFKSPTVPGVSLARQRGRIYLGPLNTNTSGTDARPTNATLTTVSNAMQALNTDRDPRWVVWSATQNDFFPITQGFIDNEYDTQRRRGRRSTTRTVWSQVA